MVDYVTNMPFKFDPKTEKFEQKGNQKSFRISAGLNGHAVMRGYDHRLYDWVEEEGKWKNLDDSAVWSVATSKKGRLYKVDYDSQKVFK